EVEEAAAHRGHVVDGPLGVVVVEVREHPVADHQVEARAAAPARDVAPLVAVAPAGVLAHVGGEVARVLAVHGEPVAPQAGAGADVEHRAELTAEPLDEPGDTPAEPRDLTLAVDARLGR